MELGVQGIQEVHARKLADFYHVSIDYLFAREPLQPPQTMKDVDTSLNAMTQKLYALSNDDLIRIAGVIEGITATRVKALQNGQAIKPTQEALKFNAEIETQPKITRNNK